MNIIIIGAGIGGLTTALALRRQGHRVTLYEQSQLNQETGAAIFLPPNSNGLLREYNFLPEHHGANLCLGWRQFSLDGALEMNDSFSSKEYQFVSIEAARLQITFVNFFEPWQMIHRQKLHAGLKALAEHPSSTDGPPSKIVTSSRVVRVDVEKATVYFEDDSHARGDVVIGADGLYSTARDAIQHNYDNKRTPYSVGHNCFRFLIDRECLLTDPATKALFEVLNTLTVWADEDRKLVCYPCDDNRTMNFVAIHPAHLSNVSSTPGWHGHGSKTTLLSIYGSFCSEVKAVLALANQDQIRLYPLMDMEPLPCWTSGFLALVGDAAHPFLPHLGQGGAQAIEDAASLGVFLSHGTSVSQVPARLAMYELSRKDRAHRIQRDTRDSGRDRSELEQSDFDFVASREYQFRHNEIEHSREVLQEQQQLENDVL